MKTSILSFILIISALCIFPQSKSIESGLYLSLPRDSCSTQNNAYTIVYSSDTLCLKQDPVFTANDINYCDTGTAKLDGNEMYVLNIKLNEQAAIKFKEATERNVGKRMVMIIDNEAVMAPVIRDPVTNGRLTVSGDTKQKIDELKMKLQKEMQNN